VSKCYASWISLISATQLPTIPNTNMADARTWDADVILGHLIQSPLCYFTTLSVACERVDVCFMSFGLRDERRRIATFTPPSLCHKRKCLWYPLKRTSRELKSLSGTFQGKVMLSQSGAADSRYHDTVSAAFKTAVSFLVWFPSTYSF
jgi:hypothetical protein